MRRTLTLFLAAATAFPALVQAAPVTYKPISITERQQMLVSGGVGYAVNGSESMDVHQAKAVRSNSGLTYVCGFVDVKDIREGDIRASPFIGGFISGDDADSFVMMDLGFEDPRRTFATCKELGIVLDENTKPIG